MAELIALVTNQVVLIVLISYLFLLWVALIFWTLMDITRRTENPFARLGSVFLVGMGFVFGFVLYLILRPATTSEELKIHNIEEKLMENQARSFICPSCSDLVREEFLFCANCGCQVKKECFACKRVLEIVWNQCPYCGAPASPRILPSIKEVNNQKPQGSFFTFFRRLFIPERALPAEIKRGPGRPRKIEASKDVLVKRGRGRPRKNEPKLETTIKRGRGRPRKTPFASA
jgi:hypothetical protein